MILRRFMKHVTDQNWFAVGLDVIVVIVGIFLGLQVQAFYEEQQERQLEIEYLERMLTDADNSITAQLTSLDEMTKRENRFNRMLEMMSNDGISINNLSEFSSYYSLTRGRNSTQFFEETINEMISSGTLSTIQSTDFRTTISRFREEIRAVRSITLSVAENIRTGRQKLDELVTLDTKQANIIMPPDQINNSLLLYNLINANAGYYKSIFQASKNFHEETKRFRDEIGVELERLQ